MTQLTPDQIKAALEAGIITPEQADAMRVLTDKTAIRSDIASIGNEDDMRFVRSFSDIFIAIGIGLLLLGLSGVTALFGGGLSNLAAAALVWLMAEYFGRKKRAHLPTLICALAFFFFAMSGLFALFESIGLDHEVLVAVTASLVMFAFYWRIRLPFCIVLIAGALLLLFFTIMNMIFGDGIKNYLGWLVLLCGLVIFSVALWYDAQDKHRTTRFSDNAFWLHFIAAPLIIHGLIIELISLNSERMFRVIPVVTLERADAWLMMFIVCCLGLTALAINRRALLVSSLGYAAFAIGFLVKDTGLNFEWIVTSTLLLLGAGIIFLGVAWHGVRNQLIKLIPKWKVFPPPYDAAFKARVEAERLTRTQ